jgi:hypothetical protein
VSRRVRSTLECDLCDWAIIWKTNVSRTMARRVARTRGWRIDKLNRDVCDRHPRPNRKKENGS